MSLSSIRLWPLVALLVLPEGVPAQGVAGTYEFLVLDGDGPTADTAASGVFVLMEGPVPTDDLPIDLLREAEEESGWLIRFGRITPNACFGFGSSVRRVDDREFYGGIIGAGLTTWSQVDGSIEVRIYQSPDASLVLRGLSEDGVFSGRVQQRDYDLRGPIEWLPFLAHRVRAPSTAECISAIELGRRLVRR